MKIVLKVLFYLGMTALITWLFCLTSCSQWCDPDKIRSGKSNQHHDRKKFIAKITNLKQEGPLCVIRYINEKKRGKLVTDCNCNQFQEGAWTTLEK